MSKPDNTPKSGDPAGSPAAVGSALRDILNSYRSAVKALHSYRNIRFRRGQFVLVNSPRFHGIGVVSFISSEVPPDLLPVKLENGNTWTYPIEEVEQVITDVRMVPRSVRRMKLRWYGCKLGAVA